MKKQVERLGSRSRNSTRFSFVNDVSLIYLVIKIVFSVSGSQL